MKAETPQLRVVLDTNCLLQILGAESQYNFLFDEFLNNSFTLCVSTAILLEYEEILSRKASPVAAHLFLNTISCSRNVERREPYYRLELIKQDADDNKFVDCAFACQADVIVTNDRHFEDVTRSSFPKFCVADLGEFSEMIKRGTER